MGLAFRSSVATFVASLVASFAPAQSPLGDLNSSSYQQGSQASYESFAEVGNKLLFTAETAAAGIELFWTDGTNVGLLADINPGTGSSTPFLLTEWNGQVFFQANDGSHGSELWVSDGSAAGTRMLVDLRPGPGSGTPKFFAPMPTGIAFLAYDSNGDSQVWISDGSAAGTRAVAPGMDRLRYVGGLLLTYLDGQVQGVDVATSTLTPLGIPDSVPLLESEAFGGFVWMPFGAWIPDPAQDASLWKTDGTAAGTSLFSVPGLGGGEHLAVSGSRLVFDADSPQGREAFGSDGTVAGTTLLIDAAPGADSSSPFGFETVGSDVMFFAGRTASTTARDLFRTDGTPAGTVSVAPVGDPGRPVVAGGKLYWFEEFLWVSDGTTAGTTFLWWPVPGASNYYLGDKEKLGAFGSQVVFFADDDVHGPEPWISDGWRSGTRLLTDLQPPRSDGSWRQGAISFHGEAVFVAETETGPALMISDGTPAGTLQLTPSPLTRDIGEICVVGDHLYFTVIVNEWRSDLWKSDGTPAGTGLFHSPGNSGGEEVENLTAYRGELYFLNDDSGWDMWKTDGTVAGTVFFHDEAPLTRWVINDRLFFVNYDGLWISDGTAAGTVLVHPDQSPTVTKNLTAFGDKVVLQAVDYDPGFGQEPWITDGTPAGTIRLADIFPGDLGSHPRDFTPVGNLMVFSATDGVYYREGVLERELWVTDGTPAGTSLLLDINPATWVSSNPRDLTSLGDRIVFIADDGVHGDALWSTDGTTAGTTMIADIRPGDASSHAGIEDLARAGDLCVFTANDGVHGRELWLTDGTQAGTRLAFDLNPGGLNGVEQMTPNGVGNSVVLVGNDGSHRGLFVSDGTSNGTFYVGPVTQDLPLAGLTDPAAIGEHMFFAADNRSNGLEPYAAALRTLQAAQLEPYGRGCASSSGAVLELSAVGVPEVGTPGFALQMTDSRPGTLGFAFLGLQRALQPTVGGCNLYAQSIAITTDPVAADPLGTTIFAMPIPYLPALIGQSVFVQAASIDPGGAHLGLGAFTNGLLAVIGS